MDTRLFDHLESNQDELLKELSECDLMLRNDPYDGRLKNRKIALNKLIFENEQTIVETYQRFQKNIFINHKSKTESQDQSEVSNALAEIDAHKDKLDETAILDKIDALTRIIEDTRVNLPTEFVQAWDNNLKLQKKSTVTGKFKLVIPIIPKVFTYEKEMPYNLVDEFKQMRTDFKNGHYFLYPKAT